MKILLLCGGSGKRLWPLSNQVRSKQFLKLLSTEDNKLESMLQRVCRLLESTGLLSSTYLITSQNQMDIVLNQLDELVPVICEPSQKGTFSAIALAVTYLTSQQDMDLDEPVCVLPVDSFADESFYHLLKQIPEILHQSKADLAHIGVEPKFPSDQFGYIVPEITAKTNNYYSIKHFIEKPNRSNARQLMKKKALWNCGVYGFTVNYCLRFLKKRKLPTDYNQLLEIYSELPNTSFDQMVAEQCSRSIVIPFTGEWKDIGSWTALSEHMESHLIGHCTISNDSVNTHIVNELPQPVHVIGISDSMVVAGRDGILVSNKKRSSEIKQLLTNDQPQYVEKRWGSYEILGMSRTYEGMQSVTKIVKVHQNKNISYHLHHGRKEMWTVISGTGELILNGKVSQIIAGDVLVIPIGTKHAVRAKTPLTFIEVQLGVRVTEKDITRITYSWHEAVQHCK
jgi:mannose-1-phosphate guanylyltransferase